MKKKKTKKFESAFDKTTKIWKVYSVLKDRQWHCRECEYTHVGSTQIAGGSGIQGLQRGTAKRKGMEIESGNHLCVNCGRTTRQDRWSGNLRSAVPAPSMPRSFAHKAIQLLGSRDVVENVERTPSQLTVDHKLPMLRWDSAQSKAQNDYANMTDGDIRGHFQLLKKSNGSVSHNLLKSRACERCYKTGNRGTPFGVAFYYEGDGKWRGKSKTDAGGCKGCGWYDFDRWRTELNREVEE